MTIQQIENKNRSTGHHFFDEGAIKFFKSRISEIIYEGDGGVFFVTSEKPVYGSRMYSVRQFLDTGEIITVSNFCSLTRSQAHSFAKWYSVHGVPAERMKA